MAASQDRYVNSQDGLNLRATAGGALLRTLAHGTHLTALGQPTAPDARGVAWQNVKTDDGQSGWVAAQYLSAANPTVPATASVPVPAPVAAPPPPAAPSYVYVNSSDGLNLRADKNSAATLITTLANGQRLQALGTKFGPDARGITWLNVQTDNGQRGWVAAQYVTNAPPAPKPVAIPTPTVANADDIAAEILRRTNVLRQQKNVPPVTLNDALTRLALAHSQYMAQSGNISHTDASGLSGRQRIANAGFGAGRPMENIFGGQATVDDAWTFWVNDPPHLDVLLSPYNTIVGIGVYKRGFMTYFTMDFGKP